MAALMSSSCSSTSSSAGSEPLMLIDPLEMRLRLEGPRKMVSGVKVVPLCTHPCGWFDIPAALYVSDGPPGHFYELLRRYCQSDAVEKALPGRELSQFVQRVLSRHMVALQDPLQVTLLILPAPIAHTHCSRHVLFLASPRCTCDYDYRRSGGSTVPVFPICSQPGPRRAAGSMGHSLAQRLWLSPEEWPLSHLILCNRRQVYIYQYIGPRRAVCCRMHAWGAAACPRYRVACPSECACIYGREYASLGDIMPPMSDP